MLFAFLQRTRWHLQKYLRITYDQDLLWGHYHRHTDGQMDRQADGLKYEQIDDGQTEGQTDGQRMDRRMDRRMDVQMDGHVDGKTDGRTDGQTDR
jgi:hypothetical protein